MVQTSAEVIDLDTTDEETPIKLTPRTSALIDLTIESSDEDETTPLPAGGHSNPTPVPVAVVPPLNGVNTLANAPTQTPPRETTFSDEASHSDSSPVKRNNRKKRQLNMPDTALLLRGSPPPRKDLRARVANARPSTGPNTSGDGDSSVPIKRPSFIAKKKLTAMHRMKIRAVTTVRPSIPQIPQRNPNYRPYSPTAASIGAGMISQADWYVDAPPAGWHSKSTTAYPYLPLESPRASSSTTKVSNNGGQPSPARSTSSPPLQPHRARKRNRTILSDDESDNYQPTAPAKKRKYSIEDDDDLELEKGLDDSLQSVVSKPPKEQKEATAVHHDNSELFEREEEEIDELVETTQEDEPEPPEGATWRSNSPDASVPRIRTASLAPELEGQEYFEDDTPMDNSGDFQPAHEDDAMETKFYDADDADVEDAGRLGDDTRATVAPPSSSRITHGPRSYVDRDERDLKRLLDEFSDVLDHHPEFSRGYRRPNIAPPDATWVRLRPHLRRKLELERLKLQKQDL